MPCPLTLPRRCFGFYVSLLLAAQPCLAQTVIYVDADAAGANNGSSWADAFTDLQTALAASVAGNQIWVAAGTYKPAGPGGPRTATFQLRDGVGLYGGFAGGETSLAERDIEANPTILSGDLNADDGPNSANNLENSYHVVSASQVGPDTILDGLIISGGNGNESGNIFGGGLYITNGHPSIANCVVSGNSANHGGGLYCVGSPLFRRCHFLGNTASGYGGGMRFDFATDTRLVECTFTENTAGSVGGALVFVGGQPALLGCVFRRNSAVQGGAIGNFGSPALVNCAFAGNTGGIGGAMWNNNADTNLSLVNCIFSANVASSSGGAVGVVGEAQASIANCVFWENSPDQIRIDDNNASVRHSCIQDGWVGGTGNISVDPLFVDPIGPDGVPGSEDDNLRLAIGSPCIDAGTNGAVPADILDLDADGDTQEQVPIDGDWGPRFRDDPSTPDTGGGAAPVVDMGMFEFLRDCNTNAIDDYADLIKGTSQDCNSNGEPDECEPDCNSNGVPDECDLSAPGYDCQPNGVLDECEIAFGTSVDSNGNGTPDECECVDAPFVDIPQPPDTATGVPVGVALSANGAVVNRGAERDTSVRTAAMNDFECGFRPWLETSAEFRGGQGEVPDPDSVPLPVIPADRGGETPRIGPLGPDDLFLFEDSNHEGPTTSLMVDAANALISAHGDRWGLVGFWANFSSGSSGPATYQAFYNDVSGIGLALFDSRAQNGLMSNRIQGFVIMHDVANWDHGSSEAAAATRLMLAHQFEHRFGVYLTSPPSRNIIFQGDHESCGWFAHWNWRLDGQGSGMGMREWTGLWPAVSGGGCGNDPLGGCFNSDTGGVFSFADLYLMGYVSAEEMDAGMSQFRYLSESDCSSDYFGSFLPVSSADIIAANGPRIPNSLDAQHHFKAAWIMIYQPGAPPTSEQIDRALGIMTQQQNDWYYGTLGRGTLDNSIISPNCVTEYDFFLDTVNPPANLVCESAPLPICRPGPLQDGTTYYWQVVATNAAGTVAGPVWSFTTESRDCNGNGRFDPCDLGCGESGGPCDVSGCGMSLDCNENGLPDDCDTAVLDCNTNGTPDDCDIVWLGAGDCNLNLVPDDCDIAGATSDDCNLNFVPDDCDIAEGTSADCTATGVPDECESDCNTNSIADSCDLAFSPHWDCNADGLPDGCNLATGALSDCNDDSIPDECDSETCVPLWAGFEPAPPFGAGVSVDGINYIVDGTAWENPSGSASIVNQGCPNSTGKALKIVSQPSPTSDYVQSEDFGAPGGPVASLSFDVRSEALLNPRIDWQLAIRDRTNGQAVILIHWASTQSMYPGVAASQRGRILVQNPTGTSGFLSTGFAIPANTCYGMKVTFDVRSGQVQLFINDVPRVTTPTPVQLAASRMSYFRVEQKANGQAAGGVNRLALDNVTYCAVGAFLTPGGMPDCNTNGVLDACDIDSGDWLDCNTDRRPDACEPPQDFDGDGEITLGDFPDFAGCLTVPCDEAACDPALYGEPCCARADFESDGDVDLVNFAALQRVLPALPFDFDLDDDVDLDDAGTLIGCLTGPGIAADPECAPADGNGDTDADLADFAAFQEGFPG